MLQKSTDFPDYSQNETCQVNRSRKRNVISGFTGIVSTPSCLQRLGGRYSLKIEVKLVGVMTSFLWGGLNFEVSQASAIPAANPAKWLSQEIAVEVGNIPLSIPP
jgi:hypothetical protein